FIGVKITAETSSTAKATLDTYQAEISEKINQSSFAQITDFRIEDKWVEKTDLRVTVYLLGKYKKDTLLKEQARIKAVFAEQVEAVAGPEREGDILFRSGEYYAAAVKYLEAAAAAVTAGVDNADIKFERNINKARNVIGLINLIPLNDNLKTYVGQDFPENFLLKVAAGGSSEEPGLKGVPIRVVYLELRSNGRMGADTAFLQSDGNGIIAFRRPIPRFVGDEKLTMSLDLGPPMEALENLPEKYKGAIEGLEQLTAGKRVSFNYKSISRASTFPIAVLVLDVGKAGNPIEAGDSAAGIVESLSEADFDLVPISVDFSILSLSDTEIINRVKELYGAKIDRLVFGISRIDSFSESGDNYIVKVTGSVKVADIKTGSILYSDNKIKNSRGSNSLSAISAAFKELGRSYGKDIVDRLP
ncbi:MAG: hypothetical protein AB1798_12620, partial [Spirochaetota bacterium]